MRRLAGDIMGCVRKLPGGDWHGEDRLPTGPDPSPIYPPLLFLCSTTGNSLPYFLPTHWTCTMRLQPRYYTLLMEEMSTPKLLDGLTALELFLANSAQLSLGFVFAGYCNRLKLLDCSLGSWVDSIRSHSSHTCEDLIEVGLLS